MYLFRKVNRNTTGHTSSNNREFMLLSTKYKKMEDETIHKMACNTQCYRMVNLRLLESRCFNVLLLTLQMVMLVRAQ